jgi:hypothetical protein
MAETRQSEMARESTDYDAADISTVTPAEDVRTIMINRVSWGAVLAGMVVALVVQLILNMIGIGVGAATLNPGMSDSPTAADFSTGAAVWWAAAGIIAALCGGYTAGRLAGKPKASTAAWHGLTTWALTTLVIFYLLTSTIGGVVGGAYRTVTSALGNVANTVGSTAQTAAQIAAPNLTPMPNPFASIEQSIKSTAGDNDPAALRDAAVSAVRAAVTGDEQQTQDAQERAAQALSRARNIPVEQARMQVQDYAQQYRQAVNQTKQRATEMASATAKIVTRAALIGAISLLLGALAGWFGGRMGAVEPTLTRWLRPRFIAGATLVPGSDTRR